MKTWIAAWVLLVAVASPRGARPASDLDAPKADAAHHKVEFENEWVRVVRWSIPPHGKTALHEHPSLVNVILTEGDLRLTAPDGKASDVHVKAGSAAWRGPTVHVAENIGDRVVEGVLVEPKGDPHPSWTAPAHDAPTTDAQHEKVEFENDQVRIVRYTYAKGAASPMHDHPTGVQIVLTDDRARATTPDGKTSEVTAKAGQVRFRPAFSHAIQNEGERFEGLLVDLKNAPTTATAR